MSTKPRSRTTVDKEELKKLRENAAVLEGMQEACEVLFARVTALEEINKRLQGRLKRYDEEDATQKERTE